MSEFRLLAERMRAAGVPDTAILEAILALEDARSDKLEQRRENDRERQRRSRDSRQSSHVTSRDPAVTGSPPPSGFPSPTPPSFPKPPSSSLSAREAFQARREEILEACQARVDGVFANGPAWNDFAPILNLLAPETGEPCDLESDIFPAIIFKADQARKTGKPIRSWAWIGERAVENRNRRLAGAPAVVAPAKRASGFSKSDELDKMLARGRK